MQFHTTGLDGKGDKVQMTRQALEGVKVADFCWALAGPLCTKVLADHGDRIANRVRD